MGAMERMLADLGRARRRGGHVLMPEEVPSPMDLHPTLTVSAALIADCARDADHYRSIGILPGDDPVLDDGMRRAALGNPSRRSRTETA